MKEYRNIYDMRIIDNDNILLSINIINRYLIDNQIKMIMIDNEIFNIYMNENQMNELSLKLDMIDLNDIFGSEEIT